MAPENPNVQVAQPVINPLNPDRTAPLFNVKFPGTVNVPLPVNVPFNTMLLPPRGFAPKGKVQSLFTVLALLVCAKVTRLNVTLLQAKVAVDVPSNVIVPPLALKVGVPEIVNDAAKVIVPEGAVKVPPRIVNVPLRSAPLGKVSDPVVTTLHVLVVPATQTVLLAENEE